MKITDNPDEVFDIVNDNDVVIGTQRRGIVNFDPSLIHRSIYVLVFSSKGQLFFHQRSATKDTDPLLWTISCSGHVGSGSSYIEAAHRELQEELGIDVPLKFVDKFIIRLPHETEMTAIFTGTSDGPFQLHPQEIVTGKFLSKEESIIEIEKGRLPLSYSAECVLQHIHWL